MHEIKNQRVGPKGVSSGVSFRKLPNPSFSQIKNICNHYEAKCTGKYSSLASRYVVQMGKEIKEQIALLEEIEERELDKRTARELRETLQEWKEHFGENDAMEYDNCTRQINESVKREELQDLNYNKEHPVEYPQKDKDGRNFMSPVVVKEEMNRLRNQVVELKHQLAFAQDKAEQTKFMLETELDNHAEAFRKSAEVDRKRQQSTLAAMRENYNVEMQGAREEVAQSKKDAEEVILRIRKTAEKSISEVIASIDGDKQQGQEEIKEERKKLQAEYENKMQELDFLITNQERLQREAVNKECKRLKHQHAIELSEVRRDGILKGCKAIFGDKIPAWSTKSGRLSGYCHACGGIENFQKDYDEKLGNRVEIRKCICGAMNVSQSSDASYCELRIGGRESETKRLKSRVMLLEDMVQTLMDTFQGKDKRKAGTFCER